MYVCRPDEMEFQPLQDVIGVQSSPVHHSSPEHGQHSRGNDECVSVVEEYVVLTSTEAAETLCREDEAAYREACGQSHVLRLHGRKRPHHCSMHDECLEMMRRAQAMKVQRKQIIFRLREAFGKREYIQWELNVATEKLQSRAARVEATRIALHEWSVAKGFDEWTSRLNAVLATAPGRRAWKCHMEVEAMDQNPTSLYRTSPPWNRNDRSTSGKGRRDATFNKTELTPPIAQPNELSDTANSSSETMGTTPAHLQDDARMSREEGADNILSREDILLPPAAEDAQTGHEGDLAVEGKVVSAVVAKLYLALDALCKDAGAEEVLDPRLCAEFREQWPRERLPVFLDLSLLEPACLAAEQRSPPDAGVSVADLSPAREALRLEAQSLSFDSFLQSTRGQNFVLNAMEDGTVEPNKAQYFTARLAEGAQFDEDAQGYRRFIEHADEWMNSRLIHAGVEQRIRVQAAEPVLRALLEDVDRYISAGRGEIAVIVQHTYSLAAPYVQKAIRGALESLRLPSRKREMLNYAFLCAAWDLQRVFRGAMARWRTRRALVAQAASTFVMLQASIRGFLVRRRILRKRVQLFVQQAMVIQRVFRGFRCRDALQTTSKEKKQASNIDLQEWASLVIQRHTRAWHAKSAVRAKKVEVGLTCRASKLADRLVATGGSIGDRGVCELLSQVDADYRRYERVIGEMETREDEMATTFVTKVLERRDVDVADAWATFVGAAVTHDSTSRRRHTRGLYSISLASEKAVQNEEKREGKIRGQIERYLDPVQARTLPSPYLRSTLPAHVKLRKGLAPNNIAVAAGRRAKRRRLGNPISNAFHQRRRAVDDDDDPATAVATPIVDERSTTTTTGIETTTETMWKGDSLFSRKTDHDRRENRGELPRGQTVARDGSGRTSTPSLLNSRQEQSSSSDGKGFEGSPRGHPTPTIGANSSVSLTHGTLEEGISVPSLGSEANSRGNSPENLCRARTLGRADEMFADGTERINFIDGLGGWESAWDTKRANRGLIGKASSRFPGSSVRQDLPSGLEEIVERFCTAAFLRGHVPEGLMPAGTTAEEAYKRYLELPPSLAKIRHEQLCRDASKSVAAVLRDRGFVFIRQMLPLSKLEHLFRQAGAHEGVTLAAGVLVRELQPTISGSADSDRCATHRRGVGSLGSSDEGRVSPNAGEMFRGGSCDGKVVVSREGARGGNTRPGTAGSARLASSRSGARKKRISLRGLALEGTAQHGSDGDGRWDPRRYAQQQEQRFRPPGSVVKRRWDEELKTFVMVNHHSFDSLYRKHNPPRTRGEKEEERDKNVTGNQCDAYIETGVFSRCSPRNGGDDCAGGGNDDLSPGPQPDVFAKKMEAIMREEYGTFFDGMTPTSIELYKHMIDDIASWGHIEDPVTRFLCRAAFYVVEHPSPPTKAELEAAEGRDVQAKVSRKLGGKPSRLARPITLSDKLAVGKLAQELIGTVLSGEEVRMGLESFRSFVQELDAAAVPSHQPLPPGELVNRTDAGFRQLAVRVAGTIGCRYGSALQDPRRVLLERRLEAAEMLGEPFALRLEADGVSSLKVLARTSVRRWGLPECLVEQIERMLGLLTARLCASVHYHGNGSPNRSFGRNTEAPSSRSRGHCEGGHAPFRRGRRHGRFDPRFQRSALDPFGRPPRLELIQPCLDGDCGDGPDGRGPHGSKLHPKRNADDDTDEGDLPSAVWERPEPSVDATAEKEEKTTNGNQPPTSSTSVTTPSCLVKTVESSTVLQSDFAERDIKLGEKRFVSDEQEQRRNQSLEFCRPLDRRRHQPGTAARRGKVSASAKSPLNQVGTYDRVRHPTKLTCRELHCGGAFTRSSTRRKHELSHRIAPEYHRLKRAPQLFRDASTAPWEGAGAPAAIFRLRTELPASVLQELAELQQEGEVRRRRSLLALPGLPGAMATWAGVATMGKLA